MEQNSLKTLSTIFLYNKLTQGGFIIDIPSLNYVKIFLVVFRINQCLIYLKCESETVIQDILHCFTFTHIWGVSIIVKLIYIKL